MFITLALESCDADNSYLYSDPMGFFYTKGTVELKKNETLSLKVLFSELLHVHV